MGTPKLLLPWAGTTVLGHLVAIWRSLNADPIAVVTGPPPHPVWLELAAGPLRGVEPIINPNPESGMFSSIQAASRQGWPAGVTHVALVLGDQPQIRRGTLETILERADDKICQPRFKGRAKHPVVFPVNIFQSIAQSPAPTLRDFLERECERTLIDVDDPGLAIDLDTRADYEAELARLRPSC